MRRPLAILLLVGMTFPAMTVAQTADVPIDLARALLAGGGSPWDDTQWVEIIVGGPPRQWKIEPLRDLQLMGSAAFANTATVVYAVDGDLRGAEQAAIAQFEAAGWKLAPQVSRHSSMDIGFVPTDAYATTGPRRPLCKSDRGVMISPLEVPSGPRVLRVVYMGSFSAGMCNPPSPPAQMRDPWAEIPMPKLEAPTGLRVLTSGRGAGSHSYSSDAIAFGTMEIDKLLAHYAEQMATKGWQRVGSPAVQKATAAQTWQMKHEGADWNAIMVITAAGDDMRTMLIKVSNLTELSKRRGF